MTSLEGCTKRSGRNPGQSPGTQMAGQLSGRQYLVISLLGGEVLPSRQLFYIDMPRTKSSVTTALLSTAFQAGRDIFFIVSTY